MQLLLLTKIMRMYLSKINQNIEFSFVVLFTKLRIFKTNMMHKRQKGSIICFLARQLLYLTLKNIKIWLSFKLFEILKNKQIRTMIYVLLFIEHFFFTKKTDKMRKIGSKIDPGLLQGAWKCS